MKRKEINDSIKVGKFYIKELVHGFMGEQEEGKRMLEHMGLPSDTTPFSAVKFLQNSRASWKDKDGNKASIWFSLKSNQIECFGAYLDKKKSIRVFREWKENEDREFVSKIESEAIGDLCMKCIYENLDL